MDKKNLVQLIFGEESGQEVVEIIGNNMDVFSLTKNPKTDEYQLVFEAGQHSPFAELSNYLLYIGKKDGFEQFELSGFKSEIEVLQHPLESLISLGSRYSQKIDGSNSKYLVDRR